MPFQNTGIVEAYKWPSHGLTQGPNRGELQTAAVDGKICMFWGIFQQQGPNSDSQVICIKLHYD